MVQLGLGGLGLPSNNVGPGLSEALQMGTQGFMQGAQLKMQQQKAAAEQAAYEQALKEATFRLSEEQSHAAADAGAGSVLGQVGNYQPPLNGASVGPQGPIPAGAASRQQEFQDLNQHHADVWKQASDIASRMDPKYSDRFLNDVRTGMVQDAMNLKRSHVGDALHDGAASGQFDAVDPTTGERVPSPELRQQFSQMADSVKSGDMDPVQAETQAEQAKALLNKQAGEVRQRITIAAAASNKLDQEGGTAYQHSFVDALRTGSIDTESWQKVAPYIMSGMVQGPNGHWLTPQDAALEQAKMKAETQWIGARPGIEQTKADNQGQRIDNNLQLGNRRIDVQQAGVDERAAAAAQADKTKREIAANALEAEVRKASVQSGFTDQKALDKALTHAGIEYKNGIIPDAEAYQKRVDELYKQLQPAKDAAPAPSPAGNPAEIKLIGDMKAQGKSADEIRAAVLKLRGGK